MKKQLFTLFVTCASFFTIAQTTTQDGNWITGATWGGSSPGYTGLSNPIIDHDVESASSLNFSTGNNNQGGIMYINNTLVVRGSIIFSSNENKAQIFVGSGATLIIFGNLDMGKNNAGITVAAGGVVVVTGTIEDKNGGEISGAGKVYTNNPTDLDDGDIGEGTVQPIDNLDGDGYEDIENYVNDVEAGGTDFPLPVELLYFTAQVDQNVGLKWSTSVEINNDYFSIERSEDGEYFYEIGEVKGNGNTNEVINYTYEDRFTLEAVEYYRLKQVDYNGSSEYLEVIRVETKTKNNKAQFMIYPTVVENHAISIKSNSPFELKELNIYSLDGSSVRNMISESEKENQITYSVNLNTIEKGVYLVKMVSTSGQTFSSRLFVK